MHCVCVFLCREQDRFLLEYGQTKGYSEAGVRDIARTLEVFSVDQVCTLTVHVTCNRNRQLTFMLQHRESLHELLLLFTGNGSNRTSRCSTQC